jgi:hypothetical protein
MKHGDLRTSTAAVERFNEPALGVLDIHLPAEDEAFAPR